MIRGVPRRAVKRAGGSNRNNIQRELNAKDKVKFPYGHTGTNITDLVRIMMISPNSPCSSQTVCTKCNAHTQLKPPEGIMHVLDSRAKNINSWFKQWQNKPHEQCSQCKSPRHMIQSFTKPPELLVFSLNVCGNAISKSVWFSLPDNKSIMLPLQGIVNSGSYHFTSCIVAPNKDVWFHDGMVTKRSCIKEGHLSDFTEKDLKECDSTTAVLLVYGKK
jgi:hypothetical protein